MSNSSLMIDGRVEADVPAQFLQYGAFSKGLEQWQAGHQDQAIEIWKKDFALDLAIDHGMMLAAQGKQDQAMELLRMLETVDQTGRVLFEQASILEKRGDLTSADKLYTQAAQQAPNNYLAQLMWARRLVETGGSPPDLSRIPGSSSVISRWLKNATDLGLPASLPYLLVLKDIAFDNREVELRYADLLLEANQQAEAEAHYNHLGQMDELWGILAKARLEFLGDRRAEAEALYIRALPLAQEYSSAYDIGMHLQILGNGTDALRAFELAVAFSPTKASAMLGAGDVLRATDVNAARQWYERALEAESTSGYPDYSIGALLVEENDFVGAEPYLRAAVEKRPDLAYFADLLARVRVELSRRETQ